MLTSGNEEGAGLDSLPTLRVRYNRAVVRGLDAGQFWLVRHWLAALNSLLAVAIALPVLAPILLASGLPQLAEPIYGLYRLICHQWPFRSFFLLGPEFTYSQAELAGLAGSLGVWDFLGSSETGYKMAFCERDLAIGLGGLMMGLLYIRYRRRLAPPRLLFFFGLVLPLAVDGFTQIPGWRESTWEFRVATGAIAGIATMWLITPYLDLRADRFLQAAARLGQSEEERTSLPT